MAHATLLPLLRQVRPIAETFVPALATADDARLAEVLVRVDERLMQEAPALRRQLRLFVRVLYWLPVLWTLRSFAALAPDRRLRLLEKIQDGPVGRLRLGLWGLRTLVYLGWYGDPAVAAEIGWRPSAAGWEAP